MPSKQSNNSNKTKSKAASKRLQNGKIDIDTKAFMQNPQRFADAFNFLMYNGEQVIKPEALTELDTTEIALPYGNNAREPIQKFRDLLKKWTIIMKDDNAVYVFLGIENQAFIHYAIAVKNMLYDAMNYDKQVRNAGNSYKESRKNSKSNNSDDISDAPQLHGDEFPSNFRKEDKLVPVITLVIYYGADEWDAPRSIWEMLSTKDKRILKYVQNYKINLIEPYKLSPKKLKTFTTDLGLALKFIKYSKDKKALKKVISQDERYRKLNPDAFFLMNDITKSGLKPIMRGDKVDMCAAIEAMRMEERQEGRAEGRKEGIDLANERVARDMLQKKMFPLSVIAEISKLSEDVVRGIAKSLGIQLVRG